eukprot:5138016-Prymnesium_polylepis.1
MTFANESFFHVLRKWGTKHSHFGSYYSIAIWCSVLSWNENVGRQTLEYVFRVKKSGQLKSSAGRGYTVPIRVPQTAFWRAEGWAAYKAWVHARDGAPWTAQTVEDYAAGPLQRTDAPGWLPAPHAMASYWLGWRDADPPQRARVVVAQVQAPPPDKALDAMTGPELQAELLSKGLDEKGKVSELRERAAAARENLEEARAREAPTLDRRDLPPRASPRGHVTSPRAAPPVRPGRARGRTGGDSAGSSTDPAPTIVKPLFGLRSPYKQKVKKRRKLPPQGQKQWTDARVAAAKELIARGEQPVPLKRSQRESTADSEMPDSEISSDEMHVDSDDD